MSSNGWGGFPADTPPLEKLPRSSSYTNIASPGNFDSRPSLAAFSSSTPGSDSSTYTSSRRRTSGAHAFDGISSSSTPPPAASSGAGRTRGLTAESPTTSPPRRASYAPTPISSSQLPPGGGPMPNSPHSHFGAASRARAASLAALHEPPVLLPRSGSMPFGPGVSSSSGTSTPPNAHGRTDSVGLGTLQEKEGGNDSGSEYSAGEEESPPWRGIDLAEPEEPVTMSPLLSNTFQKSFKVDKPAEDEGRAQEEQEKVADWQTNNSTESVSLESRAPSRGASVDPAIETKAVADPPRSGSSLSVHMAQVGLAVDTNPDDSRPRSPTPATSSYQPRRPSFSGPPVPIILDQQPAPTPDRAGSPSPAPAPTTAPIPIRRKSSARSLNSQLQQPTQPPAGSPSSLSSSPGHRSALAARETTRSPPPPGGMLSPPPRRPSSRASNASSHHSREDDSQQRAPRSASPSRSLSQDRSRSPSPRPGMARSSSSKTEELPPLPQGGAELIAAEQQQQQQQQARLAASSPIKNGKTSALSTSSRSHSPSPNPSAAVTPNPTGTSTPLSEKRRSDLPAVPAKSLRRGSTVKAKAAASPSPEPSVPVSSQPSLPTTYEPEHTAAPAAGGVVPPSPALSVDSLSSEVSASDFADVYGGDEFDKRYSMASQHRQSSHIRAPATMSSDANPTAKAGLGLSEPSSQRGLETPSPGPNEYFEADAGSSTGSVHTDVDDAGAHSRRASEQTISAADRAAQVPAELPPLPTKATLIEDTSGRASPSLSMSSGSHATHTPLDAKARALAFVADLKRAREENSVVIEPPPPADWLAPSVRSATPLDSPSELSEHSASLSAPARTPTGAMTPLASSINRLPASNSSHSLLGPSRENSIDLSRRRPLPPSLLIGADLKKCRTAGDRALVYAGKINALRQENSGLSTWLAFTRASQSGAAFLENPQQLSPGSPSKRRQAQGSFPYRAGSDGYRAKEIPPAPSPNFTPTVPYPGALNSSSSSRSYSSSGKGKPSFFGLGRKSSSAKRSGMSPNSAGLMSPGSSSYSIGSPLGQTVSNVSVSTLGRSAGPPISGPRAPKSSFDIVRESSGGSSAEQSPLIIQSPSLPAVPSNESSTSKLDRMADMLPYASRDALADALVKAGGDDVAAISLFLAAQ